MPLGPTLSLGGEGIIVEALVVALYIIVAIVAIGLSAAERNLEKLRKEFDDLRRRLGR